jgi:hypothetical protein
MPKSLIFKNEKKIVILVLFIICALLVYFENYELKLLDYKPIPYKPIQINKLPVMVSLFKISKEPLQANIYEPIKCVDSSKFIVVTKLCVHDKEKDVFISGSILGQGIWEGHLMGEL